MKNITLLISTSFVLAACQNEAPPPPPPPPAPAVAPKSPPPPSPAPKPAPPAPVPAASAASPKASGANPIATITTSKGVITVELDIQKAPQTVQNFITYAKEGFYDGTIFHRVIKTFMIQGGGFTPDMHEKQTTHPPVKNESSNGLPNNRGTIAMARMADPDSATSQFFINVVDNMALNYPVRGGYTVFGKVTSGMDVVDQIKDVPTHNAGMMGDIPNEPVIIESVRVK